MKDSEFIELLNLYLDHEITAADAARLEAEVQSNPNRRRIYQDYCRMQKGCKMLAQDFATEAPATDRNVVAFEQAQAAQRGRKQLGYVAAGVFAAAACVAFLVVGRTHVAPSSSTPAVAIQDAPKVSAQAVVAAAPIPASENKSTLNELSLRNQRPGLVIAAKQTDPHFAWIDNVQLTPVQLPTQLDPLHLENNSGLRTDERTYTSGNKPLPADVQMTAIRFQR